MSDEKAKKKLDIGDPVLGLILERIGEVRTDVQHLRDEQNTSTAAWQSFGFRLTAVEERIAGHQAVVNQRMKKQSERMERVAGRVRELGGIVDGHEITKQTSLAALEAERRMIEMAERRKAFIAKLVVGAAGVIVALSTAIVSWVFFK